MKGVLLCGAMLSVIMYKLLTTWWGDNVGVVFIACCDAWKWPIAEEQLQCKFPLNIMLSTCLHLIKVFVVCCLNCPADHEMTFETDRSVKDNRSVSFYEWEPFWKVCKSKTSEHLLICLLPMRGTKRGGNPCWCGGRRGGGVNPASHSDVRACDSGDTWSHLSAVYTFLSWSLSYTGDHLSYSKKESKQAGQGWGWGRGERLDGWRERKEAWALCVNAGFGIVKRAWRWQLNALIFYWDSGFVSHGGLGQGAVTSAGRSWWISGIQCWGQTLVQNS